MAETTIQFDPGLSAQSVAAIYTRDPLLIAHLRQQEGTVNGVEGLDARGGVFFAVPMEWISIGGWTP